MEAAGITYYEQGRGDTALVLLHYFGGGGQSWQPLMDHLASTCRCIAPDMPGFGATPAPSQAPCVADYADALSDFIEKMNLGRYLLVGHSMGGKVALALAARRLPGLLGVVLVAPSPPVPEPMSDQDRQGLRDCFGDAARIEAHLKQITARSLPPTLLQAEVAHNLQASATAWNAWLDKGSREDISPQMAQVAVPVHVFAGAEDKGLGPGVQRQANLPYLPAATLATIPNAGHLIPQEQPKALAQEIAAWIRAL